MSAESAQAFVERMKTDTEFAERVAAAESREARLPRVAPAAEFGVPALAGPEQTAARRRASADA